MKNKIVATIIWLAQLSLAFSFNGSADKLCPSSNRAGQVCTIKDRTIHLTSDFVYDLKYDLVLDNTLIRCVTSDGLPCKFVIKQSEGKITLSGESKITGKQVVIKAPNSQLEIFDSSVISTSGQSMNTKGTGEKHGASYIAQGGSCENWID